MTYCSSSAAAHRWPRIREPSARAGLQELGADVPTVVLHVGDCDQRGEEIYVAAEDAVA
jgi:hypothetical protein